MTRIIRGDAPRGVRRPSPERTRVLHKAQQLTLREAEQILQSAREQATALLTTARTEAEQIRQTAAETSQAEATARLLGVEQRVAELLERARAELTSLGVQIAEKILDAELRLHPDAVTGIVAQCLRASPRARQIRLLVNPADLPLLAADLPRLTGPDTRLGLEASDQIARGGCRLETELGEVDGRLQSQLARLAEALQR